MVERVRARRAPRVRTNTANTGGALPERRLVAPALITFPVAPNLLPSLLPYNNTYTEFELQADTWWRLNADGFYTRGEVDSRTGRLDLVVYFIPDEYKPLAIIEVKRKRNGKWELTGQGERYLQLGIPIILYWRHEQYRQLVLKLMELRGQKRKRLVPAELATYVDYKDGFFLEQKSLI